MRRRVRRRAKSLVGLTRLLLSRGRLGEASWGGEGRSGVTRGQGRGDSCCIACEQYTRRTRRVFRRHPTGYVRCLSLLLLLLLDVTRPGLSFLCRSFLKRLKPAPSPVVSQSHSDYKDVAKAKSATAGAIFRAKARQTQMSAGTGWVRAKDARSGAPRVQLMLRLCLPLMRRAGQLTWECKIASKDISFAALSDGEIRRYYWVRRRRPWAGLGRVQSAMDSAIVGRQRD